MFGLSTAVSAPLLLKAKETCNLSSETCAVLHQCLEQLSKQEEVGGDLPTTALVILLEAPGHFTQLLSVVCPPPGRKSPVLLHQ